MAESRNSCRSYVKNLWFDPEIFYLRIGRYWGCKTKVIPVLCPHRRQRLAALWGNYICSFTRTLYSEVARFVLAPLPLSARAVLFIFSKQENDTKAAVCGIITI